MKLTRESHPTREVTLICWVRMHPAVGLDAETVAGTRAAESDVESIGIHVDRRPTRPLPPVELRLAIDLENPDEVADYLEAAARSIRASGRLSLVIERPVR